MRLTIRGHIIAILLVGVMPYGLKAEMSEAQVRSATQKFMEDVPQNVRPSRWQQATIQSSQSMSAPEGQWHVCTLVSPEGPAGYVLLHENATVVGVVGFSGTSFPVELIPHLLTSPMQDVVQPPLDFKGTDSVRMVATIRKENPSVAVAPISAAAAAVIGHLQERLSLPLFLHVDDLDKCDSFEARLIKEKATDPPQTPQIPTSWRSQTEYLSEREAVLVKAGLLPQTPTTSPAGFRRITNHVRAFEVTQPLRRTRLSEPSCPDERWQILRDEQQAADLALYKQKSKGMVNAFLLQSGYLAGAESPHKGIEEFFISRGLVVICEDTSVNELKPEDLPCIVFKQRDVAGVLVGLAGTSEERWGLLVLPNTVVPQSQSLSEKLRANRIAAGKPPDEPEEIDPSLPPETRARIAAQLEQLKQLNASIKMIEDPTAKPPDSLSAGAHFIQISALSDWRCLRLSTPVPGPNWGQLTVSTQKE